MGLKRSNSSLAGEKSAKKHTRLLDQEVLRAIKKRVPSIQDTVLMGHEIDGLHLLAYCVKEKTQRALKGKYLTEDWWLSTFTLYDVEAGARKPVIVANQKEKVPAELVDAISIARSKNSTQRNRSALVGWLRAARAGAINQRTMAGMVCYLITLRPLINEQSAIIMTEFMRMVIRENLKGKHKKDFKTTSCIFVEIFF